MKRLMFSLLVLLMASFVSVNAQVINNEVQFKGSATNVYMGGKHVRDMNDLTFTVAPTEDGRCCLSGHAAFLAAGITYHDMDFTLKKVVFATEWCNQQCVGICTYLYPTVQKIYSVE